MEVEAAPIATNHKPQLPGPSQGINPTEPSEGESLPEGYARNYASFLIKMEELVAAEERFLQDHLVVASFIGGRPSTAGFPS